MTLPFRAELTLRWTVSFGVLLAATCLVIYLGARAYARAELDAEVRTLAGTEAASVVDDARGPHIHDFPPESVGLAQTGKFVQVLDAQARVLLRSRELEGLGTLLSAEEWQEALAGRTPIKDVSIAGRGGRAVGVRRDEADGPYVVVAGLWSDRLERSLRHLALLLLSVWLAGLALTGVLGFLLASRVLRPVERITLRAAAIAAGDLKGRLDPALRRDEIERMTDRLSAMLGRLQEALEANRRFAASASHELRTPLAAIQGEVEVALRRDRSPESYRRALTTVGDLAREMSALIGDLLTLVRALEGRSELELREVPLGPLVEGSRERLAMVLATRGLRLETVGLDGLVAYGDVRLLGRLVDNVLANAAQHCRQGGRITVTGRAEADAPGWSTGRVAVQVCDEGTGIPAGEWTRILEPFERVEATGSVVPAGQGLGLAIAREVARLHGGDIRVLASSHRGTTFEIALRGGALPPLPEALPSA